MLLHKAYKLKQVVSQRMYLPWSLKLFPDDLTRLVTKLGVILTHISLELDLITSYTIGIWNYYSWWSTDHLQD